ncbi:MAG: hypothetical protein IK092_05195 [Muribaculaceae bacterium]|nr:hypothetical protein [Muribaculaceae bacterium]
MLRKTLITTLLVIACAASGYCRSIYSTKYNGFGSWPEISATTGTPAVIHDDCLVQENTLASNIVVIDSTLDIQPDNYSFLLRLANANNKEGKSYKYRDNGATKREGNPRVGLVFHAIANEFWSVELSCHNTQPHNDFADERYMLIELIHYINNVGSTIKSVELKDDINLTTGFNFLKVSVENQKLTVAIGDKRLSEVLDYQLPQYESDETVGVGYLVSRGAKLMLERSVLTLQSKQATIVNELTPWTLDSLYEYFNQSSDPYEGFWTYLDRDIDDKWLKLGGRYKIALVNNGNGYDIIYIEGAKVKGAQWKTGMLKGRMTKTIFTDNYNAMWVDSTLEPLENDVYATFESGYILNIKFPLYNSQLRFSKVPRPYTKQ